MSGIETSTLAPRPAHIPAQLVVDWDVFKPTQPHEDIHQAWKNLHNGPDIFWTPHYGGHWVVTRAEDIDFMQRNYDPFSVREIIVPPGSKGFRTLPSEADPPEHAEYRAIVLPWFAPRNIDSLSGFARDLAAKIVDDLYPRGECEFYTEFSLNLPIAIFCKLADIPWSDKDMLLAWAEDAVRGNLERRFDAFNGMTGYVTKLIAQRRANPGTDIVSDNITGTVHAWRYSA